jgi:hypothetical protein
MQTPEQRVSDRLRLSRLYDTFAAQHRQIADWEATNPKLFDKYREAGRRFVIKNNLKPHRSIPFDPAEAIGFVLCFNQNWSLDTEFLQELLDFTRVPGTPANKYFGKLSVHSLCNRLYEIARWRFHQAETSVEPQP